MSVHAATPYELAELTWFANSGRNVERALGDNQDVLCNWVIIGKAPRGSGFRTYLSEASCDAVACIDGDGVTFGAVSSPTAPEDWAEFLQLKGEGEGEGEGEGIAVE